MCVVNGLLSIRRWIKEYYRVEYELKIWFPGVETPPETYQLSNISKKTQTHIVGQDMFKKFFEIKTTDPMNFRIKRIK